MSFRYCRKKAGLARAGRQRGERGLGDVEKGGVHELLHAALDDGQHSRLDRVGLVDRSSVDEVELERGRTREEGFDRLKSRAPDSGEVGVAGRLREEPLAGDAPLVALPEVETCLALVLAVLDLLFPGGRVGLVVSQLLDQGLLDLAVHQEDADVVLLRDVVGGNYAGRNEEGLAVR